RPRRWLALMERPWCCTPSLTVVVSALAWRAHRWRCPYVGTLPTYGQRALGTVPLVAAHRLTDLLLCPGMQAQAERPHALAWCLLCSDSGIQLDTTQYPAWANHPCASWLVIAASASVMACSKASSVRAALARTHVLTLDQHSSIGEKSGEYGGSWNSRRNMGRLVRARTGVCRRLLDTVST